LTSCVSASSPRSSSLDKSRSRVKLPALIFEVTLLSVPIAMVTGSLRPVVYLYSPN